MKTHKVTAVRGGSVPYMTWLLIGVFAVQFCLLAYANLFLLKDHLGYDSSWSIYRAALMWEEKALVSDQWVEQTSLFLDSPVPLAALLYGATGKLLFSYGLSNQLVVACICVLLYMTAAQLGLGKSCRWLCLDLAVCPYLMGGYNDLSYCADLLCGPSFYSVRALLFLMILYCFMRLMKGERPVVMAGLSVLLCFVAGTSSGIFILIMIGVPCVLFLIVKTVATNSLAPVRSGAALYIVLCFVFTAAGKLFAKQAWGLSAIDATRTWTTIDDLWTNFGAVFIGFMKLTGTLCKGNIAIISAEGIKNAFPLLLFVFFLVSVICGLRRMRTGSDGLVMCGIVVVYQLAMFGLFNAQYGSHIFEERYLICLLLTVCLLVGYFVDGLRERQIGTYLCWTMLLIALAGNTALSDQVLLLGSAGHSDTLEQVRQAAEKTGVELVYVWGDELLSPLGRPMRAYDTDRTYRCICTNGSHLGWGDSRRYRNNEEYSGETLLVAPHNAAEFIPAPVLDQYILMEELDQADIYWSRKNPVDQTAGITSAVSIDYPYTPGMETGEGVFIDGSFASAGTEGYALCGPYADTVNGRYDFTLYYKLPDDTGTAVFAVAQDGETVLAETVLDSGATSATLENVALEPGHKMEYRVFCEENTSIRIDQIVIEKKD